MSTYSLPEQLGNAVKFRLPDKTNVAGKGWNDETPSPAYEPDKNYGVHMGKSGLLGFDADRHDPNADGVKALEKLFGGELPDTFCVKSPRDGVHAYFSCGVEDSYEIGKHTGNSALWAGLDVMGGPVYLAGPGTYRENDVTGTYEVLKDLPIAPLPDEIKALIEARIQELAREKEAERAKKHSERHSSVVAEGTWAKNIRPQQSDYERFIDALEASGSVQAGNGNWQCPAHDDRNPSMSVNESADGKLLVTCHSGCEFEDILDAVGELHRQVPSTAVATRSEVSRKASGPILPADASGMAGYLNLKSFAELDRTPLDYRIDGLLPMGSNVLFSAYRKAGKTTTVLHLLKALTSREKFIGRATEKAEGTVVYLNLELTEQMLADYAEKAGLDLDNEKLKVAQLRGEARKLDILSDDFAVMLAETLSAVKCEVLVVDPLSAVLGSHGIDEWSNPLNRQVLEQFGAIASLAEVDTMIIVDHAGHAEKGRSRGASSKEDWADVLWVLDKKSDGSRTLKIEGRGVEDATITFTLDKEKKELTEKASEQPLTDDPIFIAVNANPGIETSELVKLTGIKRPTLINRVEALEARKVLRVERPGMKKPNKHYPAF